MFELKGKEAVPELQPLTVYRPEPPLRVPRYIEPEPARQETMNYGVVEEEKIREPEPAHQETMNYGVVEEEKIREPEPARQETMNYGGVEEEKIREPVPNADEYSWGISASIISKKDKKKKMKRSSALETDLLERL
jgi:hypothetical protein